jgi:hypothetical protein
MWNDTRHGVQTGRFAYQYGQLYLNPKADRIKMNPPPGPFTILR